jgi:hypothetical protein
MISLQVYIREYLAEAGGKSIHGTPVKVGRF